MIRVTGGHLKGWSARSKHRSGLRPTSERVRMALFSVIGEGFIRGSRVLDLYSGTGIMGIEALSRGASAVDFVERHSGRCREIRVGLDGIGKRDQCRVYCSKVESALKKLGEQYDLVIADPPYSEEVWLWLPEELHNCDLLSTDAIFVAEHRRSTFMREQYQNLRRASCRRYGDTSISIYETLS